MIQRRTFMAAMLAACAAPAIASGGSLMRIKPVTRHILWGDGIKDDTAAVQALLDGGLVYSPDGVLMPARYLTNGIFKISAPLIVSSAPTVIAGCVIKQTRGDFTVKATQAGRLLMHSNVILPSQFQP
jgi:hypothetical protein